MNRLVLDLCAGTGAWSEPYKAAGYKVVRITLPHYDVTKVNIDDEFITFLAQRPTDRNSLGHKDIRVRIRSVHGILAAPPCTEFSVMRYYRELVRPNFQEGLVVVEACERIIRTCKAIGYLKWWALENPRGHLRKFLGIPKYTFERWQFGDPGIKPTDLWGYFNPPAQTHWYRPTLEELEKSGHSVRAARRSTAPPEFERELFRLGDKERRAAIRAITPPGFAQAFFRVNR